MTGQDGVPPRVVSRAPDDATIGIAGDAQLHVMPGSLRRVTLEDMQRYADQCLTTVFDDMGFVLQDIVNELGRRLEYEVVNGGYRGVSNQNLAAALYAAIAVKQAQEWLGHSDPATTLRSPHHLRLQPPAVSGRRHP